MSCLVRCCFFLIIISCFYACRQKQLASEKGNGNIDDEKLIVVNKHLVVNEEEEINGFVNRYHWNVKQTPSGLRYVIYYKGNGAKVKEGKEVKINYTVSLINGTLCYSSSQEGPKIFTLGEGQVERGLEEGLMLLSVGDKAKFIIPSHLAYGLLGDQNMIPKRATLIYDVELLELKDK